MRPFPEDSLEDDMKAMQRLLAIVVAVTVTLVTANYARPARGARESGATPAGPEFVLVAHGGAGTYKNMTPELLEARRAAMVQAIQKGYAILARGGSGLDAVEATIRVMEDSGLFDSGRGAYYTRDGVPEMDAAIMDGRTLAAGSVASVQHIANPISLARLVMEKTPHVMLVSRGAEEFAQSQGIELMSPYYFYNEREWQRYEKLKAAAVEKKSSALLHKDEHGTVGVVALDRGGNLAAGTSTGGTTMKMPGRVGDSPIIGAGTYANNASCAVSGTGVGEYFMRNIVAADICERVRYLHVSLEEAANDVVMKELAEQHGEAGVIALTRAGDVATPFNTDGMMTGTVRADGKIVMTGWSKTAEPMSFPAAK
jgi:L-asparaginase / beta-aspartyl-peptidase